MLSHKAPPLKGAFIISAIVHVAMFTTLVAAPKLLLPISERPMRIDVMWVELPRGTSDDIGLGIKKSETLPRSTIEEQKKLFEPEGTDQKVSQKMLEPKMKAPPEKPKPKEKTKRPEIPISKKMAVKKTKPRRRSAIDNALAKIDRQLSRRVVPEAAQVDKNNEGYKYGTSNKPLRVKPSNPEYIKYQAMVRAKIIRQWIVPSRFTEEGQGSFNARLEVLVNTDGDVTSIRWASPSGNATFDQSAVRAVRKASPFPKPPDILAWEAYNEGFLIEFDPRLKR